VKSQTFYGTTQIGDLSIFYREAGPKDAPTLLLLHGLPSSSRMFEPIFARLSIAITLSRPITRASDTATGRTRRTSSIRFEHYAKIMSHFSEALELSRYTLYMQDYGGPWGFRMASRIRTGSRL